MSGIEEKGVTFQQETLRNVGLKHSVDEDVGHLISLTEAEKEIEKKLVTRIDLQVMPLVLVRTFQRDGQRDSSSSRSC